MKRNNINDNKNIHIHTQRLGNKTMESKEVNFNGEKKRIYLHCRCVSVSLCVRACLCVCLQGAQVDTQAIF